MPNPHRRPTTRRRRVPGWLLAAMAVTATALLVLTGLRFLPGSPLSAKAAPTWINGSQGPGPSRSAPVPKSPGDGPATPEAAPLPVRPATVKVKATGRWGWALLDTRTGKMSGSANMAKTSTTASLIKSWIGADFLRRSAAAGEKPGKLRMAQLTTMIRDSDNNAAQALWSVVGRQASTNRMLKICKLTDSSTSSNWSLTRLSPRDIARLGACIADGRAAGPRWTKFLLNEMRLVRGIGNFGIRKAFPASLAKTIAIKNGWVIRDEDHNNWHVNCLAIGDGWTMGIMTVYPPQLDYTYGAKTCLEIARQLRA